MTVHNLAGDDNPFEGREKMNPIKIECDRCHNIIEGFVQEGVATSKFYDVSPGQGWDKFANPGENNVCDRCLHQDARYRASYGFAI